MKRIMLVMFFFIALSPVIVLNAQQRVVKVETEELRCGVRIPTGVDVITRSYNDITFDFSAYHGMAAEYLQRTLAEIERSAEKLSLANQDMSRLTNSNLSSVKP